jgi:aerobic carbon-monoxide dehydrogenase large subunit
MTPRVAIGGWDAAAERYTLTSRKEGVIRVPKLPKNKMRVISPDVGGGLGRRRFGLRGKSLVGVS